MERWKPKRKGIEKYYEALELYRRATDRNGEAQTLNNIGVVYRSLGEMQKALEKYNEALPLRRAAGDRSGEAQHSTTSARSIDHWEKYRRRWRSTMKLCRSGVR